MQWISFKGPNGQEFINLDTVESIRITEKEITFFFKDETCYFSKEVLRETYEYLRDYFEQHFDCYKIN